MSLTLVRRPPARSARLARLTRLARLACLLSGLALTGCATPRWVTVSDHQPDDAINGKYLRRAVVVAVREAIAYETGPAPYELVLPVSATPETYAGVTWSLGSDALIPAGIPVVAVDASTGKVQRRDKAVIAAERLDPPRARPAGDFPVYEVRSLRLSGQTGEVDVVRPLGGGRRLLTVGLDLDPGYGWRATDVRVWRALDPDAGL